MKHLLKHIPSIEILVESDELTEFSSTFSKKFLIWCARKETEKLRNGILSNRITATSKEDINTIITGNLIKRLKSYQTPKLRRVINGTGIILHTNLGRALLTEKAGEYLKLILDGYTNLEFDLETGKRGNRLNLVEEDLCFLTGAEAVHVVNNNAAAVLLSLNTLAHRKEVIVSRGQLIEIGDSFRMPEIIRNSGVELVEIGTTNRTKFSDYENALTDKTGAIFVAHTSNYKILGFTEEADMNALVELSKKSGVPLIYDLGGGVLFDLGNYNLPHEPIVEESLKKGVDVVTFSGDKVFGGPQCGIIGGRKDYVTKMKKNNLSRALRCDKLILAALEGTIRTYLRGEEGIKSLPTMKMLLETNERLRERGEYIIKNLKQEIKNRFKISISESYGEMGSGALPLENIKSTALKITGKKSSAEVISKAMREHNPPVIGYIKDDTFHLDLRTIQPEETKEIMTAINNLTNLSHGKNA